MKHIEVAAAIICNNGSYFACQRGYGDFEGLWEFPGGKIEHGESPEDALKREVQEELGIDIAIDEKMCTTEYDYPSFHLKLHCYLCSIISGEIELREHHSSRWFNAETLNNANWLPADKVVIEKLKMVNQKLCHRKQLE